MPGQGREALKNLFGSEVTIQHQTSGMPKTFEAVRGIIDTNKDSAVVFDGKHAYGGIIMAAVTGRKFGLLTEEGYASTRNYVLTWYDGTSVTEVRADDKKKDERKEHVAEITIGSQCCGMLMTDVGVLLLFEEIQATLEDDFDNIVCKLRTDLEGDKVEPDEFSVVIDNQDQSLGYAYIVDTVLYELQDMY